MQAKVLREISPHKFPWRSARERVGGSSAHIYARPHRHKSSLQKIFGFVFLEPACATKKSKKTLLFLSRRFAPHSKISHLFKPVLFGLHYTTKSEPFSSLNVNRTLRAPRNFVSCHTLGSPTSSKMNSAHGSQSLAVLPLAPPPRILLIFSLARGY